MNEHATPRPRGSGSIYQNGSSVWWVKYYRRGIAFRESSHSPDRKAAEKLLKRRLAEIETKTYIARTNVRVDELIEDVMAEYRRNGFKSLKSVTQRWERRLRPFFHKLPVDDLTTNLVQRYCEKRKAEGAANGTVNREVSILRHAFNLGLKTTPPKVRMVPVMPMYKEADPRTGFLPDADYARLAAECNRVGLWLRALLTTAYSFGFRKGELLGLKVKQVDLSNRTIRLEAGETKNGAARVVKLTQEVGTLLTACCIGKKPDDCVFSRDNGKAVGSFRKIWKTVCTRADVPDLLFHDLRRSGVRNLRRLGVQESVAMRISGHKTRSVFERYNIVDEADLAEAARKLDEKKTDAPEFGHSSGIVAENSTKNRAAGHPNLTAAVLPN
jgi:integrase